MRAILALASILVDTFFVSSLKAEEVIKNQSPDEKFALRLVHGEEGWDTEIIETATKKKVIDLESVALPEIIGSRFMKSQSPRRRSIRSHDRER